MFRREKARAGARCGSRSHARLETRPRAQAVNAGVRNGGERGIGMAGNGQGEEESSHTDRQTDRPAGQRPCRLQRCLQHPHLRCGRSTPFLTPWAAQPGVEAAACWELCRERAHSPAAPGCSHCWSTAGCILTAATSREITLRHRVTPGLGHSSATLTPGTRGVSFCPCPVSPCQAGDARVTPRHPMVLGVPVGASFAPQPRVGMAVRRGMIQPGAPELCGT